jgi:hypothetical protein
MDKARKKAEGLNDEQEKPIDIVGDAPDKIKETTKAFEALKKTISQGSGATSIFDSVLEGMNTLISGAGTANMKVMSGSFSKIAGYFKDAGEIAESLDGGTNVAGETGGKAQVSMATQIVNAIQTQTDILVKSLTGIDKSINNIAFVI